MHSVQVVGMLSAVCFVGHPAGAASRSASGSMGKGIQAQDTILSGTGCCGRRAKGWMQTWSCSKRNNLAPQRAEDLVYVHYNRRCVLKSREPEKFASWLHEDVQLLPVEGE